MSATTTSLTDLGTLRHAAADMITEAWGRLAEENVVPCSRYRPYVQAGRDYEGGALANGPAFVQFSAALWQLYPSWFEAPQGQFPRWYPDNVAFHVIDACIAELSARGETGDTPNDAVEVVLLELADYLDSGNARLACARRVLPPVPAHGRSRSRR